MRLKNLTAQMIASFILVVILTAAISGLPGIWMVRQDMGEQAWSRVEQEAFSTRTLYTARENELVAFAKLVAHRQCLQTQIQDKNQQESIKHLFDLVTGTGVPLVVVCDVDSKPFASTVDLPVADLCAERKEKGFAVIADESGPHVWVYGSHEVEEHEEFIPEDYEHPRFLGWIVAAVPADDVFFESDELATDLEFSLLQNGKPILTSFDNSLEDWSAFPAEAESSNPGSARHRTFELDGHTYYALREGLAGAGLEYEVALSDASILHTQREMSWLLILSILVAAVPGLIAGVFLARRISQPLEQLTETAVVFSSGNLSSPVTVESELREVVLVAKALEDARSGLLHTLTELNKEKAWRDHLLESIVEGIMILDANKRITFFSHGAERITGWSRDEVLNRSCDEVFRLPETNGAFSECVSLNRDCRAVVEIAGGRWVSLAITGAMLSVPEADDIETAVVFRNVSDEEVIHRRLGHFMANVTHEFRTPLSALAASVELLLDQTPSIDPVDLEKLLQSLHLSIFRLQNMVDNLIESASIEAGHFRVSPHPNDLKKIISDAAATMTPLLEKYGQRLRILMDDDLPLVWADSRRTVQVLINLLSNANKFGPADSEILVEAERENNQIRVSVVDEGPGIPSNHREAVFQRFTITGSKSTQAKAGAGLGLSVVKAIIQAQGGQVGLEDRPGGGSVFWFTLNIAGES